VTSRVDFTIGFSSAEIWVKCSFVLALMVDSSTWTGTVAYSVFN